MSFNFKFLPILISAIAITGCNQVGFQANGAEAVKAKSVFNSEGTGRSNETSGSRNIGGDDGIPTPMPAKCTFLQMEAGSCGLQDHVNKTPVTYNLEDPTTNRILKLCTNHRNALGEVSLKFALANNLSIELVVAGKV